MVLVVAKGVRLSPSYIFDAGNFFLPSSNS